MCVVLALALFAAGASQIGCFADQLAESIQPLLLAQAADRSDYLYAFATFYGLFSGNLEIFWGFGEELLRMRGVPAPVSSSAVARAEAARYAAALFSLSLSSVMLCLLGLVLLMGAWLASRALTRLGAALA